MNPPVRKHHHAVISLGANDAPHTLSRLADRVKRQVVVLLDLKRLREIVQPRPDKCGEKGEGSVGKWVLGVSVEARGGLTDP